LLLFFKKEVLSFFFCPRQHIPKSDALAGAAPFALIVETKDEKAFEAYRFQGFRSFVSRPMSLFLHLATARKAAAGDK